MTGIKATFKRTHVRRRLRSVCRDIELDFVFVTHAANVPRARAGGELNNFNFLGLEV